MKRIALAAIFAPVLLLVSTVALADWDARDDQEAKAFEARSRDATRKEALRKQKLEADRTKAEADMYKAQVKGDADMHKTDKTAEVEHHRINNDNKMSKTFGK